MHISLRLAQTLTISLGMMAFSLQAATITVNSTGDSAADDGVCTLREAITASNTDTTSGATGGECAAGSGSDSIAFSVAGAIQPATELPNITTVVHIDGYTAPGASKNTQALAQGTNAILVVEIDGVNAGNVHGLSLVNSGASGTIIEGLVINNSANGICCNNIGIYLDSVTGAATTILRGNFIGTNAAGTARRPKGAASIYLKTVSNLVIGSDNGGAIDPASVNLISGNNATAITTTSGVTNMRIRGNLIGTNAAGTAALENIGFGVGLDAITSSWVSDNVISGNRGGIELRGVSSGVHLERNIIGSNAAGTGAVPNDFVGIRVSENIFGFPGNNILDVDIVENLVANNTCSGDCAGILIGASNALNMVQGIRLSGNRVFANKGLEIDLGLANVNNLPLILGVTENDADDPDSGGNTLQNFPLLTSSVGNGIQVMIDFTLDSEASKTFTLEFFHTGTCDSSGHGGAEKFLGREDFVTSGSGDVSGSVVLPLTDMSGFITATATNLANGTSEFSACAAIVEGVIFKDGFEAVVP